MDKDTIKIQEVMPTAQDLSRKQKECTVLSFELVKIDGC